MVRTKQAVKPLIMTGMSEGEGEVGSTTPDVEAKEGITEPEPVSNGVESSDKEVPDSTADSQEETKPEESSISKEEAPKKSTKKSVAAPAAKDEPASEEDKKKKLKKKIIPAWATLSENAKQKLVTSSKMKVPRSKLEEEVVAAIRETADKRGISSAQSIRKYLTSKLPDTPKYLFKKALKKALEKNLIKQTAGKGLSGSFKVDTSAPKKTAAQKKVAEKEKSKVSMEELFPLVFTWQCNPKEASVTLIKKYIAQHYPELDVEGMAFKKAIENGEKKGQLERITGKGSSGTFALIDGADKTGTKYEDAIENAIIAMNEPKDISIPLLRDYFGHYHKEYDTDNRPHLLKNAVERAEEKGWLVRVTGKGFSGTFRLNWPYYPSPKELWGDEYKSADESDESSDEEEEPPVKSKKRTAPKARVSAAPPKKKSKQADVRKAKPVAKKRTAATKKTKPATKKPAAATKRKSRK